MEDDDVFVRIYPLVESLDGIADAKKSHAFRVIERPENTSRYVPSKTGLAASPAQQHRQRIRRWSQTPEDVQRLTLGDLPCLEVRFSKGPRTSAGLVFGTSQTCDVVLPRLRRISARHFALTYKSVGSQDKCYHLVIRDLGSSGGTEVTYDSEGAGRRRDFDWIINGFDHLDDTKRIIVKLHDNVKFFIVVTRFDITLAAYIAGVKRFLQGAATPGGLLRGLGLQSGLATEGLTGAHTPVVKEPILITVDDKVGFGGFGSVSRVWNVSTGEEYACKKPKDEDYDKEDWEKELEMMKNACYGGNFHRNIVRLLSWENKPVPCLNLEYMPLGNLRKVHGVEPLSGNEQMGVLHQMSSALEYLHGLQPPIVHRDIKPENMLVSSRGPECNAFSIHVKVCDFGLSKTGTIKTNCGTLGYSAPELGRGVPYTSAVDIWSLGAVLLEIKAGLPPLYGRMMVDLHRDLVAEANRLAPDGLADILQHMLVIDPDARYSATVCKDETSRLIAEAEDGASTPTPVAPHTSGYGSTARFGRAGEQQTLRLSSHEKRVPSDTHSLTVRPTRRGSSQGHDPSANPASSRHARPGTPEPSKKRPAQTPLDPTGSRKSRKLASSRRAESESEPHSYEDVLDPGRGSVPPHRPENSKTR